MVVEDRDATFRVDEPTLQRTNFHGQGSRAVLQQLFHPRLLPGTLTQQHKVEIVPPQPCEILLENREVTLILATGTRLEIDAPLVLTEGIVLDPAKGLESLEHV